MTDATEVGEKLVVAEKRAVDEIVRLDPRDRERLRVAVEFRRRVVARQQRRAGAFVLVPRASRRQMDPGIGIGEPAIVAGEKVVALGWRKELHERAPGFGKYIPHSMHEPVELHRTR